MPWEARLPMNPLYAAAPAAEPMICALLEEVEEGTFTFMVIGPMLVVVAFVDGVLFCKAGAENRPPALLTGFSNDFSSAAVPRLPTRKPKIPPPAVPSGPAK